MQEEIYTGIVTYYSKERHFGFIDSEAGESIYFHFNASVFKDMPAKERKEKRKIFLKGDEVYFKVRTTEKGNEAYDLQLIKNEKADQLLKLLNENEMLPGYLKKINNEYYVKDKATYLFLPVPVSCWETDLDEVYDQRLNQFVYYLTPEKTLRLERARVKLSDRRLSSTHAFLKNALDKQTKLTATITGRHKYGYFATILNGEISSFILFKENELRPELIKWQEVEVIVKALYENGITIQLVK